MDFLSSVNPIYLVGVCCLLCVGGVVLVIILSVLGGLLDILMFFVEAVAGLIEGGPIAWCGCLVVILGCGACTFFILTVTGIVNSCGSENAVNFCRLF